MSDVRVAHIVPAPFSRSGGIVGGAERYAYELARYMSREVPTRLVTFGPVDHTDRHESLQIRVIGHPWHVRGQRSNPFSLRLFSALKGATVIHCHQQHVVASSAAAAFSRLTGRQVFVTDLGGGGWDISAYVSTDRWYHGHLHISEYSRKVFGHATNPQAHVILGGVDTEKFSPDSSRLRRGGPVVFVGRLLPHKGLDYLIEALPQDMKLEIIGQVRDETYFAQLKMQARGKQISFRHETEDAALVSAYRNAMCVVLPSVYRTSQGYETRVPELLGQTLLEGMACGIPAICTDVASMPEVVADRVTGFVVPPNDPTSLGERLRWLRDHPEQAREIGAAGRKRVLEQFTWAAVVRRCLKIYGA